MSYFLSAVAEKVFGNNWDIPGVVSFGVSPAGGSRLEVDGDNEWVVLPCKTGPNNIMLIGRASDCGERRDNEVAVKNEQHWPVPKRVELFGGLPGIWVAGLGQRDADGVPNFGVTYVMN